MKELEVLTSPLKTSLPLPPFPSVGISFNTFPLTSLPLFPPHFLTSSSSKKERGRQTPIARCTGKRSTSPSPPPPPPGRWEQSCNRPSAVSSHCSNRPSGFDLACSLSSCSCLLAHGRQRCLLYKIKKYRERERERERRFTHITIGSPSF